MATYLRIWFLALLILLIGAVALNYWVDPYGLYRPYSEGGWKPNGAAQGELVKPYLALKHSPHTLILGNSRAEVGFDPADVAWPESAQPIYNPEQWNIKPALYLIISPIRIGLAI